MMRLGFLAAPLFCLVAMPVLAQQDIERPPQSLNDEPTYGTPPVAGDPGDPAGLTLRLNRLENRIREMTGQIEELQNANRKLIEQVQKFQADVDGRLGSGAPRPKRADAPAIESPPAPTVTAAAPPPAAADGTTPKPHKSARGDAFDPDVAPIGTPGKPKPLGSPASAQPDDVAGAPIDLSGSRLRRSDANPDQMAPTLRMPSPAPKAADTAPQAGTVVADLNPASPRAEFDAALGYYKDKQYESAEKGFSSFIQKNPKSRLVADATYYLGATYEQRGRTVDAAEQYIKVSKDFATSNRAPDALLHLGVSMRVLGHNEQACATFSEVTRKYPNAPGYVKSGVERESKRAQC